MASPSRTASSLHGFPATTHRDSAASGVGFALLLIGSVVAFGLDAPSYDDTGPAFASFYSEKETEIQISVFLGGLAGVALAWFVGFVRWAYHAAELATRGFTRATEIGYAGAIAGIGVGLVHLATRQTAVVAHGTVEDEIIRAIDLLGSYALVMSFLMLSTWLLTSFFLIRVTNVFAGWLGWLAAAGAVLGILQSSVLLAPQDDDGVLGWLGVGFAVVLVAWVALVSVTLYRRVDAGPRGELT